MTKILYTFRTYMVQARAARRKPHARACNARKQAQACNAQRARTPAICAAPAQAGGNHTPKAMASLEQIVKMSRGSVDP